MRGERGGCSRSGGTTWPDALSADADDWYAKLVAASDAVGSGDLAASKTAISEAHAAWHGIEHAAYQFAAGEEVTGGNGHGDNGHEANGDEHDANGDEHGDNGDNDHGDDTDMDMDMDMGDGGDHNAE